MGKAVIDRFEGDIAILEEASDSFIEVPRSDLPANAKVGDVVIPKSGVYVIDEGETAARRQRVAQLSRNLFKD